jgi:hypothetical protein
MDETSRPAVQKGPLALLLVAAVALVAALVVVPNRDRLAAWMSPREPDVVFIVLDTVRADHLHACGYHQPNTPVMDALRDTGWAVHCSVTSPAPWTIPSHLSYFTGQDWLTLREAGENTPPTLPMEFQARGYDTVFLSANMVLRKSEWFSEGFRLVETARNFNELKGPRFTDRLAELLAQVDEDKPLFLFLNLVDAHAPYPPIPPGVGWAKPQRGIQHRRFQEAGSSPFKRYVTGEMAPEEAARYEIQLNNGYDYGVAMADENVGRILQLLRARGRLERVRVVVTSDHGELLGEHDVVGHGDTLYEPGLRVPLFYYDSLAKNPVPLPAELSGLAIHGLLRDGVLGAPSTPRYAASYRAQVGENAWNALTLWPDDTTKLVWRDGEEYRIDLAADPGEEHPLPVGDHPSRSTFDALVRRNLAIIDLEEADSDEATRKLLQQAGYLAPDE